jgi:AcrR family transcriptional regulator
MQMMSAESSTRPLRADAQRNRDALIAAARQLFGEHGPDVSMLLIAEAAGVGNGTLYRHFPDRESLITAVYRDGLVGVCQQAEALLDSLPGDVAIETWLGLMVDYVRGNLPLKLVVMQIPELLDWSPREPVPSRFAEVETLLDSTMRTLLDAATWQGLVGQGEPRDLLRLTSAICQIDASPDEASRMIALVVDGLRHRR